MEKSTPEEKTGMWIALGILVLALFGGGIFAVYTIQDRKVEEVKQAAEQKEKEAKKEAKEKEAKEAEEQERKAAELEKQLQEKEKELQRTKEELEEGKTFNMSAISDVSATSILSEKDITHDAKRIVDGNPGTGWVEGVRGQGINESVTLYFNGNYQINGMMIKAGYHKSSAHYEKNSRPAEIRITYSDGASEIHTLRDVYSTQEVQLNNSRATNSITLTILSVYPGNKYEDTVISEVSFY